MVVKAQGRDHKEVEQKLKRFLDAQTDVFQDHRYLADWCRESLNGTHDQANYDVAKRIFKDVVAFENQFEHFEIEFWNYLADVDNTRDDVDHRVITMGFADHKEYFFSKIESCVSILNDVITEVNALGLIWPFLDDLADALEKLFDASEELIEADISDLRSGEIAELLRQVPDQRAAPLEVIATSHSLKRKVGNRFQSRVNNSAIQQAAIALQEVLKDAQLELENSNCDPRVMKAINRCLTEISKELEAFSPIQFGIYVGVANEFRGAISEELGTFLSRQVIAALMQCDIFLRNFQAWEQYSQEAAGFNDSDGAFVLDGFRAVANDPLFDADVRDALDDLEADKREFGDVGKIDYAIFQSVSNALSEACRQGLRYISAAPRKVTSLLSDVVTDGIKAAVGIAALAFVARCSSFLVALSEKYAFFAWIKPIVEFIKLHAGI